VGSSKSSKRIFCPRNGLMMSMTAKGRNEEHRLNGRKGIVLERVRNPCPSYRRRNKSSSSRNIEKS